MGDPEPFLSVIGSMNAISSPSPPTQIEPGQLLEELESRQDDVLQQLDELDSKIKDVLKELGATLDDNELAEDVA